MTPTPEAAETPALIDHILTRFHAVHRAELADLLPLAHRVETVHAGQAGAPIGIGALVGALAEDLESHMQKEEQVLFPLMRQGGHPMIAHPIAVMRDDHDRAEDLLARIEVVTGGLALPPGACGSWTRLYQGLEKLRDDLRAHVALENDVLFARFP